MSNPAGLHNKVARYETAPMTEHFLSIEQRFYFQVYKKCTSIKRESAALLF
jgi:hypothetical protein